MSDILPFPEKTPFKIGMVIFPGMTNLDFAGPFEALARMPNTTVHVLAQQLTPIETDIGGLVLAKERLQDAPQLDMLFVGGGPGINNLLENDEVLDFLSSQSLKAKWITSVCTGALVLGAAGLLRGYRAATHWTAMEALRPFGAEPVNERVVIDRNRITGGGVTAGIDFALTIANVLHGEVVAQSIQLGMEYDPHPPFNAGSPSTAPLAIVKRIESLASGLTASRIKLAKKIAASRGWA